jgi:hypothetical protein
VLTCKKSQIIEASMVRGYDTVSTLNPAQQKLFDKYSKGLQQGPGSYYQSPLYQQGSQYLQNLLSQDPEAFKAFEAPAQRQFQQQIGGIAERFGGLGATSSSGFQQALGSATTDLSERLAALRAGIQMQALPQALQYAGAPLEHGMNLLNMQTQQLIPKQAPWWQTALTGLVGGAANAFSGGFGGIAGKALGNKLFG